MEKPGNQTRFNLYAAFGAAAILIAVAYFGPICTFGGTYRHTESGSTYEFRDGTFRENGKSLGKYSVQLRSVRVYLDIDGIEEPFYARIGWNTVEMPIPKYGKSRLIREPRDASN